MVIMTELWLPIVLSAVFVFLASSVIHMVLPIHKGDFKKLGKEGEVLDAMRTHGVQPGEYMFPCAASMKEMGSPEMIEKYKLGPVGFMTVLPSGVPGMGKSLVQWFLFSVLLSAAVAYVAKLGMLPGAEFMAVLRMTGTVAFLGYGLAHIPNSIWKGSAWSTSGKFMFDGLVYGVVTGATFGWLWPEAV